MLIQIEKGKVALISGGGSGHEPFCAGYIGQTTFDKLPIQAKTYQKCSKCELKTASSPQEMGCWLEGWLGRCLLHLLQVGLSIFEPSLSYNIIRCEMRIDGKCCSLNIGRDQSRGEGQPRYACNMICKVYVGLVTKVKPRLFHKVRNTENWLSHKWGSIKKGNLVKKVWNIETLSA